MYDLMKKIHMYTGLVNFSALMVFGIAGLYATFAGPRRHRPPPIVEYVDFAAPGGLTDKQLADRVYQTLDLPLTGPLPERALRRNEDNDLAMNFYTVKGPRRVVVLEGENRLRVQIENNTIWQFFDNLHATMLQNPSPDLRVRLWAGYIEVAIWSLLGMTLSGVYLWLASRPRYRPAQIAFAAGSGVFVLLSLLSR